MNDIHEKINLEYLNLEKTQEKITKNYLKIVLIFLGNILKLMLGFSSQTNGEKLRDEYKAKSITFRNF